MHSIAIFEHACRLLSKGMKVVYTIQLHFLLIVLSPLNRPCILTFELFLLLQESLSDIFGHDTVVQIVLETAMSSLQTQLGRICRNLGCYSDWFPATVICDMVHPLV